MQKLKRSMNFIALLFASVGTMIGSGWLLGPLYAAQIAGPAAIISWLIGGLLVIIVALAFGELAVMFPVAGSIARFPQFSHGTLVSYIIAWMAWASFLLLPPTEVFALLQYSSTYFPTLMHAIDGKPALTHFGFFIATILLVIMNVLNILGIKALTRCNGFLVVFKIAVPIITAILLMKYAYHPHNITQHGGFMPYGFKSIIDALPLAGIVFSFFGFRAAIDLAGEAENPQRTLPLALIGSLLLCVIVYSLVQWAFINALPEATLAQGWKAMHFAGDAGPLVGLAGTLGITFLMVLLYINAFVAPFGSGLILVATTARINYAMTRGGYAPAFFEKLNNKNAPYYAILFNFIVGLCLMRVFPSWQKLAGFIISTQVLSHATAPISLMALRKQIPDFPRSFRLPAANTMSFLGFFILNLFAYWTGWDNVSKMLITVVIGLLVLMFYRLWQTYQHQTKPILHIDTALWIAPYFAGIGLISYLGNFGGGLQRIDFGWDAFIIALFSFLIFILGIRQRLSNEEALQQINDDSEEFT